MAASRWLSVHVERYSADVITGGKLSVWLNLADGSERVNGVNRSLENTTEQGYCVLDYRCLDG